jgi:hypothetical protein
MQFENCGPARATIMDEHGHKVDEVPIADV